MIEENEEILESSSCNNIQKTDTFEFIKNPEKLKKLV